MTGMDIPDLLLWAMANQEVSRPFLGHFLNQYRERIRILVRVIFTLPEKAMLDEENGSIGILSIPALGLSVNVYEAEDEMEAMSRGVAHFKSTSAYDGNVGLSAHNINFDRTDGYFKNPYTLKTGDTVSYKTALGEREYEVSLVKTISETDWSYLSRSTQNRLTMVTCISGKPTQRVLVQAIQK